jgi:hypothetical protein
VLAALQKQLLLQQYAVTTLLHPYPTAQQTLQAVLLGPPVATPLLVLSQ